MNKQSVARAILEGIRYEDEEEKKDDQEPEGQVDKVVTDEPEDSGSGFAPDANMDIKDDGAIVLDIDVDAEEPEGELPEEVVEVMAAGKARVAGLTAEDVDPEELRMGLEVEKEHSDDPRVQEMLALDHLTEIKDYYTRLKRMEDEAKAENAGGSKASGEKEPEEPEEEPGEFDDEGPEDEDE